MKHLSFLEWSCHIKKTKIRVTLLNSNFRQRIFLKYVSCNLGDISIILTLLEIQVQLDILYFTQQPYP